MDAKKGLARSILDLVRSNRIMYHGETSENKWDGRASRGEENNFQRTLVRLLDICARLRGRWSKCGLRGEALPSSIMRKSSRNSPGFKFEKYVCVREGSACAERPREDYKVGSVRDSKGKGY